MLNTGVSFVSISSEFIQTCVPSVNKFLNALCQEQCWLLNHWSTTDRTSESGANFCPPSIFFTKRVLLD